MLAPHHRDDRPAFASPVEARLFGLVIHLNETGALNWKEWTVLLRAALHNKPLTDDPNDLCRAMLDALESLVVSLPRDS